MANTLTAGRQSSVDFPPAPRAATYAPRLTLGQRLAIEAMNQKGFTGQARRDALRRTRICCSCEKRYVLPDVSGGDGHTCGLCVTKIERAVK